MPQLDGQKRRMANLRNIALSPASAGKLIWQLISIYFFCIILVYFGTIIVYEILDMSPRDGLFFILSFAFVILTALVTLATFSDRIKLFRRILNTLNIRHTSSLQLKDRAFYLYSINRMKFGPTETIELNKTIVCQSLDQRISKLRARATLILLCILLSLSMAALTVVFAGQLTSLDASAVSNIEKLNAGLLDAQRQISDLSSQKSALFEKERLLSRLNDLRAQENINKQQDQEINYINKRYNELTQEPFSINYNRPSTIEATDILIKSTQDRINRLNEGLNVAWTQEVTKEKGYGDSKYIVATAVIRVGVIVIIIYLVRILMDLYKYNTRLITFYASQKDFIQIWDGKDFKSLATVAASLGAPKVSFGKEPSHPIEEIVKLVEATLSKSKHKGTDNIQRD